MIKVAIIILLIICVVMWLKSKTSTSRKKASGMTTWRNDDVLIRYKTKPPHFRNINAKDVFDEFDSCGFCEFYNNDSGARCKKYGVTYSGVGSVVKTVCDDFKSSLYKS